MNIKNLFNYYHVWYLFYILTVLFLFLLTLTNLTPTYFIYIPLFLALINITYEAIEKLTEGKIGTEFFLVIASAISLIGHQERAITIVLLIMLFAEYLEKLITERTNRAIKSLIDLIPKNATIKKDGQEVTIPVNQINPGMYVVIKTGGRIPVDGIILEGKAEINEASLTGESKPQKKAKPEKVFAGTFIESGSIIIEAQKVGEDTFFGKITDLVEKASEKKAKTAVLADKVAAYLVIGLLIFIGIVWLITKNLNLIITLLVFGSPLELTLVTPITVLSGIIAAFRNGILIKGGMVLENFSKSDTIFFDKTGTLTMGEPRVVKIEVLNPNITEKDIIKYAAMAEKRSGHVIAKAILNKAKEFGLDISDPDEYVSVSGHGVEIIHKNTKCFLGNKHFVEAPEHGGIKVPEKKEEGAHYYSLVYLGCSGEIYGKIFIADEIRGEAKHIIKELNQNFKETILLSGDKKDVAKYVAQQLDITKAYGEVFPDEKIAMIEKYQKEGHIVTMVGDGINDAPAIKQANVGIAMGAMGMEPAIEAADIVLTTNDLSKIIYVRELSKKTFRLIKQNIFIGFLAIHSIGMILAFLRLIDPVQAAIFHAVPDIAILLNSTRLINFKMK